MNHIDNLYTSNKFISIGPFNFLAVRPKTSPLDSFLVPVEALSILFAVLPLALVASSIRPGKLSVSFFLLIDVLSFVFTAVGPDEGSLSVHFVVLPEALELTAVDPDVPSVAFDVVGFELAFVSVSV